MKAPAGTNASHGNTAKLVSLRNRSKIALDEIRQIRQRRQRANDWRRERDDARLPRQTRSADAARDPATPHNHAVSDDRGPHDVEDVDLEQRPQRGLADEKRLQPEQKRQREDLEAAFLDGACGLTIVTRAAAPSSRPTAQPRRRPEEERAARRSRRESASDRMPWNRDRRRRVQLSITCASIMISTATPRSTSR